MEKPEIIEYLKRNSKSILIQASRRRLINFARYIKPKLEIEPFHKEYYEILDLFAHGYIKKLIVTMPPQHGKSEGSSRFAPAFILGLNPDKKIAIGSYAATIAQDFNRDVQKIIDSYEYREIFPDTFLNGSGGQSFNNVFVRNTNVIETVGHIGCLRVVGRGGSLTSKTVDIMIMDDVYKDYEEGNSPVIREKAWKWYTSVVRTRLHNDSQELIVFTRWNDDDLIGRISAKEQIIEITSREQLKSIPKGAWVKVNFEAIKTTEPTEIDQRKPGESLWENKHNLEGLYEKRNLDKIQFECLYQGAPDSKEGLLYTPFKTYKDSAEIGLLTGKGNYTDTADQGDDLLCSVCYDKIRGRDENGKINIFIAITDMVYTDEPIEITTVSVPMMINRNETRYANVESNNGGKSFSIIIREKLRLCRVNWFTQTKNKESRIITNSGLVNYHIIMPFDWETRFPRFYKDITKFKRKFNANDHDDGADVLTGIIEKEILEVVRGIRRGN